MASTSLADVLQAIQNLSNKNQTTEWGILPGYESNTFSNVRQSQILLEMNDGTMYEHQAWAEFDRFLSIDLPKEAPSGRHYIFMCRPDLNIVQENTSSNGKVQLSYAVPLSNGETVANGVAQDPFFNYLANFYPNIIASLTGEFAGLTTQNYTDDKPATASGYGNARLMSNDKVTGWNNESYQLTQHVFMPYITGRVESIQLPDFTIKKGSFVQPYTKATIPYATNALESVTGGTFDLTMRDDRQYSLHKLFYAWIYYMSQVQRNIFKPKEKYSAYNALDYATSIYDFIVDETGENVIYWGKYTGCIPGNVPLSNLSFNKGGTADPNISIPFDYFLYEPLDRDILMDFQYNSLGYIAVNNNFINSKYGPLNPFPIENTVPIYNSNTFLGANLVGRPVLYYYLDNADNKYKLKLRWLYSG